MKNVQLPKGDQVVSLADLKEKRQEYAESIAKIDEAIDAIEELMEDGIFTPSNAVSDVPLLDLAKQQKKYADMSVYAAAVDALTNAGKTSLTTDEILDALVKGGKKLSGNPRMAVATTLYKALKTKKNCEISAAGKAKWQLSILG